MKINSLKSHDNFKRKIIKPNNQLRKMANEKLKLGTFERNTNIPQSYLIKQLHYPLTSKVSKVLQKFKNHKLNSQVPNIGNISYLNIDNIKCNKYTMPDINGTSFNYIEDSNFRKNLYKPFINKLDKILQEGKLVERRNKMSEIFNYFQDLIKI